MPSVGGSITSTSFSAAVDVFVVVAVPPKNAIVALSYKGRVLEGKSALITLQFPTHIFFYFLFFNLI